MSDTTQSTFREVVRLAGRPAPGREVRDVVLITEAPVIGSLAEGLAFRGYNVTAYLSEPASSEYIGRLATHIVETGPDAVVTLAHPARQEILARTFDGVLPLVMLHTVQRPLPPSSETTWHMAAPELPSNIADAVGTVIDAAAALRAEEA